jgi:hypothetical protein
MGRRHTLMRFESTETTLRVANSPPRRARAVLILWGLLPTGIIAMVTFEGQFDAERLQGFVGNAAMFWGGLAVLYGLYHLHRSAGPVVVFDLGRGDVRVLKGNAVVRSVALSAIGRVWREDKPARFLYRLVLDVAGGEPLRVPSRWNDRAGFDALESEIDRMLERTRPQRAPSVARRRRQGRRVRVDRPAREVQDRVGRPAPRPCWFCGRPAHRGSGYPLDLTNRTGGTKVRKIPRCRRCRWFHQWHDLYGPGIGMIIGAGSAFTGYVLLVAGRPTPLLALALFLPFALVFIGAGAAGIVAARWLLDPRRFGLRSGDEWQKFSAVVRLRRRGWRVRPVSRPSGLPSD